LKIAIRVFFENVKQLFVHQWLPAQNPKKVSTLLFAFFNHRMYFFDIQIFFLTIGSHPASLALKVTIVRYGDELKCREKLSFLLPFFKFSKAKETFPNHIRKEFVLATTISFYEITKKRHGFYFVSRC